MIKVKPEWLSPLTLICMVGLVFESVTGLLVAFGPFSEYNQYSVITHTLIGIAWMVAFLWYGIRHWLLRYKGPFNHVQLFGYLGFVLILLCIISGLWITAQAWFGSRITYSWSTIHLYTGLALILSMITHIAVIWDRHPSVKLGMVKLRFLWILAGGSVVFLLAQGTIPLINPATPEYNEFPADYTFPYGKERPFAPSLGHTESNKAYDPSTLAGSKGCGSSGCHEQIFAEWEPSAHRYSSADLAFQEVQKLMMKDLGPESTRYCAGCHDPIALFSGSKNVNIDGLTSPGAEEGVSCISCHSIIQTDMRGNADYTLLQPQRYVGERSALPFNKSLSDFLIRAFPQQHIASFSRPMYKTAEYCAACHKQFIDKEVNKIGWVQLQNQYDNWRESRWHVENNPNKTLTCRECHMPLVDSTDPAAGDSKDFNRNALDGKHRSHRFLAANQVMPLLMKLPGAQKHVELTEQWLKGEIEIPEIADRWKQGPVIRMELEGSTTINAGQNVDLKLLLTNNKTGHGFPTGPMDVIRSWVEITVKDDKGELVYESGKPSADGLMNPDAIIFKAEGIDRKGKLIDRHNLWEMVGAQYKRVLFPGMTDSADYRFIYSHAPAHKNRLLDNDRKQLAFKAPVDVESLLVVAELKYQKADAAFMDRLFGKEAHLRTPITTISKQILRISVAQQAVSNNEWNKSTKIRKGKNTEINALHITKPD